MVILVGWPSGLRQEFAKLWGSKKSHAGSNPAPTAIFGRDARVDDRGCLENSCTSDGTVGSNPTPAANQKTEINSVFYFFTPLLPLPPPDFF
jgi:hypothetical protein